MFAKIPASTVQLKQELTMNSKSISAPRHGKEVRFGDLILTFTSTFQLRWSDAGSGADRDVSFYHPVPPAGFHALGSVGIGRASSDFNPDGNWAVLCVKAAEDVNGKAALARPTDYDFIWNDEKSGARMDGSCWRPLPPDGYVALGDVFVEGHSKPSLDDVMCVAQELVFEGVIGEEIWTDNGSGARRDFGAWQIDVSRAFREAKDGVFAVGAFVGRESHDKPSSAPVAYTLCLPLPTVSGGDAPKPTLDSRTRPADKTMPVIDHIVTVPFTAVIDPDKTLAWQVENSPFYDVERAVYYDLVIFEDNTTNRDQTKSQSVTNGVTREKSETFSINTGIKVSYESGVQAGAFSSKVAVELSIELGYSTTTNVSVFQSVQETAELTVPAQHAAALWVEANSIRLIRSDNTPVGPALAFPESNSSYLSAQFPMPVEGSSGRLKHRRHRSRLR
jgi:hypothetical protein